MELEAIKRTLQNPDYEARLKGISALRVHSSAVAVPLLIKHLQDPEFLVRTFVARELGIQKTADAFAGLLELIRFDNTPNVRAEAVNALSLFGAIAAPHLVQSFIKDDHWLVRLSTLAALTEMDCPEALMEVCLIGIKGEDKPVQHAAIDALGSLANSPLQAQALAKLLALKISRDAHIRSKTAASLKHFDAPAAIAALAELRTDDDHTVVGAAMEPLLETPSP